MKSRWAGWLVVAIGTAISLLVIVATIVVFAFPAYRDHVTRRKVAASGGWANRAMTAVEHYTARYKALPVDNAAAGLSTSDPLDRKLIHSIEVESGTVVVTYAAGAGEPLAGRHLLVWPDGDAHHLQWHCSSPDIAATYLPATCFEPDAAVASAHVDGLGPRPQNPADLASWEPYLVTLVERNAGTLRTSPVAYFVPLTNTPASRAAVERIRKQVDNLVSSGLLPGTMIAFGGPSSSTTAEVLEHAFAKAVPGSFRGVVILFIGDGGQMRAVQKAVAPSGATFKFAQM